MFDTCDLEVGLLKFDLGSSGGAVPGIGGGAEGGGGGGGLEEDLVGGTEERFGDDEEGSPGWVVVQLKRRSWKLFDQESISLNPQKFPISWENSDVWSRPNCSGWMKKIWNDNIDRLNSFQLHLFTSSTSSINGKELVGLCPKGLNRGFGGSGGYFCRSSWSRFI